LLGEGRPVVLERAALAEAESRIKERYRITTDKNL